MLYEVEYAAFSGAFKTWITNRKALNRMRRANKLERLRQNEGAVCARERSENKCHQVQRLCVVLFLFRSLSRAAVSGSEGIYNKSCSGRLFEGPEEWVCTSSELMELPLSAEKTTLGISANCGSGA